jgi:hypothetical protein
LFLRIIIISTFTKYWWPSTSCRFEYVCFIFDWGNHSLECFNRGSHDYELWQPVQVRYRTRKEEKRISSILNLLRRDNEGRWKQRFFQWWLNSVFFSNSYILLGTYKVRNEIETKRNETKRNQRKRNETKRNQQKRNEMKRNQRKQNEIN